jgi:hypothetical protein
MSYPLNSQNKMANSKEKFTMNGVELETYDYNHSIDGKKYYEFYTSNTKTKMFINESLKTGKIMKISVWIDGYNIQLSPKYDYGMAVHIFTDLVNKFSNNQK